MIAPDELLEMADDAMQNAYAPYSGFRVGVVVETGSGVYTGCNVENAAYSPTTHAEQVAITSAIADGETDFLQMAVVTSSGEDTPPCGVCRQIIREFCSAKFPIYAGRPDEYTPYTLGELFPESFGPENVE